MLSWLTDPTITLDSVAFVGCALFVSCVLFVGSASSSAVDRSMGLAIISKTNSIFTITTSLS